jgi:hypothetical protein
MKVTLDLLKVLDSLPLDSQINLLSFYSRQLTSEFEDWQRVTKECTRRLNEVRTQLQAVKTALILKDPQ